MPMKLEKNVLKLNSFYFSYLLSETVILEEKR